MGISAKNVSIATAGAAMFALGAACSVQAASFTRQVVDAKNTSSPTKTTWLWDKKAAGSDQSKTPRGWGAVVKTASGGNNTRRATGSLANNSVKARNADLSPKRSDFSRSKTKPTFANYSSGSSDNSAFNFDSETSKPSRGSVESVPEPLTILGSGMAIGFGALCQREFFKKQKKSKAVTIPNEGE